MGKYPSYFCETQKEYYDSWFKKVLKLKCKCGKMALKKIGIWKVQCKLCNKKYGLEIPVVLKDMTNSCNWKATCGECGGIMDYYNFKYCCSKCGHILEV